MAEALEQLAKRLEKDPFFLACPLRIYAQSEKLDEAQLAHRLGCPTDALIRIRLCRAPAGDAAAFQGDIERLAAEFHLDASVLIEAVRRGQALLRMRASTPTQTLLAARDAEPSDDGGTP
jgi:hypothetical protein